MPRAVFKEHKQSQIPYQFMLQINLRLPSYKVNIENPIALSEVIRKSKYFKKKLGTDSIQTDRQDCKASTENNFPGCRTEKYIRNPEVIN